MIEDLFPHTALVPGAVAPELAAAIRGRISGYTRYALLDRGSYEISTPVHGDDLRLLCHVASHHLGTGERSGVEPFAVTSARAVRLSAGDYLLARHDEPVDRGVELVFDLSPAPVAGAEIHYRRRGTVFFRVPCAPGSLAIVGRTPVVTCNHTYVTRRSPDAQVVRLIVRAQMLVG